MKKSGTETQQSSASHAIRRSRLIVHRQVIRELSNQVLVHVVGGSTTSEAVVTGCTDTTN